MVEKTTEKKAYAFFNTHLTIPMWEVIFDYEREHLFKKYRNEKIIIMPIPYPDYLPGEVVYLPNKYWFKSSRVQAITPIINNKKFEYFQYHFHSKQYASLPDTKIILPDTEMIFSNILDAFFYVIGRYVEKVKGLFKK